MIGTVTERQTNRIDRQTDTMDRQVRESNTILQLERQPERQTDRYERQAER